MIPGNSTSTFAPMRAEASVTWGFHSPQHSIHASCYYTGTQSVPRMLRDEGRVHGQGKFCHPLDDKCPLLARPWTFKLSFKLNARFNIVTLNRARQTSTSPLKPRSFVCRLYSPLGSARESLGLKVAAQNQTLPGPIYHSVDLPYPAVRAIVGQHFYFSVYPRFWAWYIVGAFYDIAGNELWHTEIFLTHRDSREYGLESVLLDNRLSQGQFALTGNTTGPSNDITVFNTQAYENISNELYGYNPPFIPPSSTQGISLPVSHSRHNHTSRLTPEQHGYPYPAWPHHPLPVVGTYGYWAPRWHPHFGWVNTFNHHQLPE
ncbi:hypothetical protein QBC33DRAFT_67379 [Phialemonium atrogriseum]|uniref:Uncharacterized protein n=1 Tax=Phialemonium atrogriseum TaxID=1093897 RepID=A0AAJ0BZI8_9PEZI|nr:uncharacterized protein QBC33DRAFT_67379 [Phialemonium atrogriseum]KAK1767390.1 hypothetical protein QBC33DRAFT_67379 [Phialemonium atrogriseum]